ncbi:KLTH0F01518p, related [Eimeria brunetti]|uniref:KLTH0F01518p, related n=1 Tax=Eimeria brunetti TaxID=51314 RepID=U6LIM4_9EIME|nr:KLTH0F01518p, related [Eimeria brunetti]
MAPHSNPLLSSSLSSFGGTIKGAPEKKRRLDCEDGIACVQRHFNRRPLGPSSVRLLSGIFISLSVVYLLLRCFETTRGKSRLDPLTRSLAAGGGRECSVAREDEGDKTVGESAERENFWIEGVGGTAGGSIAGGARPGLSAWWTGDTEAPSGDSAWWIGDTGAPSGDSAWWTGDTGAPSRHSAWLTGDTGAPSGDSGWWTGDTESPSGDSGWWTGDTEAPSGGSAWRVGDTEAPSGYSAWRTGGTLGWPSVPMTADPGGFREAQKFTFGVGLEGAASGLEIREVQAQYGASLEDAGVRQVFVSDSGIPAPHVGGTLDRQSYEARLLVGQRVRLFPGETMKMWEQRNLPPYVETAVVKLFHRMITAASVARSLLAKLSQSQRLFLAHEVVRLLALELGAFSLVRESIEPLRAKLGRELVQLGNDALKRSGQDKKLEESRANLRALVHLLGALTQPRPFWEGNNPCTYRKKMLTLLRTATEVVDFCEFVLMQLYTFEKAQNSKPSSDMVVQQLRVLKRLFDTHSSYIARDSTLRPFIIECQKAVGNRSILSHRHHSISMYGLPPVKELVEEIHRAVKAAGGLPEHLPQATRRHDSPPTTPQQTATSHKPMGEEIRHTQQQEGFVPPSQPDPFWGDTGIQRLQTAAAVVPPSHPPFVLPPADYRSGPGQAEDHLQQLPSHSQSSVGSSIYQLPPVSRGPFLRRSLGTAMNTGGFSGFASPYASEHGSGSSAPLPHLGIPQAAPPLRWPYAEPSEHVFVGLPSHLRGNRHRSHSMYGAYAQGDRPPLLPAAARPTEHPSGEASSSVYTRIQGSASQQQEGEQEVEVGGLLAELLKGGLKYEDVFGEEKSPDQ